MFCASKLSNARKKLNKIVCNMHNFQYIHTTICVSNLISFFICGNISQNLKKKWQTVGRQKFGLLRYKINVERHKYRLISIAFISRYFNIACTMSLCLRKNFSIYRVIQVWNLHKNWCERKTIYTYSIMKQENKLKTIS